MDRCSSSSDRLSVLVGSPGISWSAVAGQLHRLVGDFLATASKVALLLVVDRPSLVDDRPGLARTSFAERCMTDEQLNLMIRALRDAGVYVEYFESVEEYVEALASGRVAEIGRPLTVVYHKTGFGITTGGYQPGRMALVPSVSDTYGVLCANSDAYTSALALHRYHSFSLLRAHGVTTPPVWHFSLAEGWMGAAPPIGTKIIVKSTYEAWSVGVTDDSVFRVSSDCIDRVSAIAEEIGQPVTLQEFVSGREVCVPIVASPDRVVLPPVEQILDKAPSDPDAVMTIHDNVDGMEGVQYVPFDGNADVIHQMQETTVKVFKIFQQRAFGRMAFRIDAAGRPWLTVAAITPGLGLAGSAFASFRLLGFEYSQFLWAVVAASLASAGQLGDCCCKTV